MSTLFLIGNLEEIRESGYQEKMKRMMRPIGPKCWCSQMHRESETYGGYAEGIPMEKYPSSRQHKRMDLINIRKYVGRWVFVEIIQRQKQF